MADQSGQEAERLWTGAALLALLLAASGCTGSGKSTVEQTVEGTQQVCSSCHGSDGRGVSPTFPRLAGQQADYLVTQLKAFRDKTRADPHAHTYMWGMAAKLSDETIEGLAASYSAMPPAPGTPEDPTDVAAGSKIYHYGIPDRNVPACITCHGERAEGNSIIPRLAGQQRGYLERQLTAFASNARANEVMHENSKNLTPDQISQVGAYLAAQ
jgi:cytochrome c553